MNGTTQHDVTAAPTVAAIGSAKSHQRLASERCRAIAALAGSDNDIHLVYEIILFHG